MPKRKRDTTAISYELKSFGLDNPDLIDSLPLNPEAKNNHALKLELSDPAVQMGLLAAIFEANNKTTATVQNAFYSPGGPRAGEPLGARCHPGFYITNNSNDNASLYSSAELESLPRIDNIQDLIKAAKEKAEELGLHATEGRRTR